VRWLTINERTCAETISWTALPLSRYASPRQSNRIDHGALPGASVLRQPRPNATASVAISAALPLVDAYPDRGAAVPGNVSAHFVPFVNGSSSPPPPPPPHRWGSLLPTSTQLTGSMGSCIFAACDRPGSSGLSFNRWSPGIRRQSAVAALVYQRRTLHQPVHSGRRPAVSNTARNRGQNNGYKTCSSWSHSGMEYWPSRM